MPPEVSQESEHQTQTTPDQAAPDGATQGEAEATSSPDVTEGASSSDAAELEEVGAAEAIRDAFLKEYGEEEPDPAKETQAAAEPEPEAAPKSEREGAPEDKDEPVIAKDDGDDDTHRLSDDEFKSLSDNAKKRIGHLNARAKKSERLLGEVEQELEVARKSHEQMQELERFTAENHIQPQAMSDAWGAMAQLARQDKQGATAFLATVEPYIALARQLAGQDYSPDLRTRSRAGI